MNNENTEQNVDKCGANADGSPEVVDKEADLREAEAGEEAAIADAAADDLVDGDSGMVVGGSENETEVLSVEDSLVEAEEAIGFLEDDTEALDEEVDNLLIANGFLEDDMEALVSCAAARKATLLSSDRDSLGPQGCVGVDVQLELLNEIFGDDL